VAGGLFLRLCLIFAIGEAPELFEYDQIARNILSGQGYVYNQFGTPYASFSSRFIYIGITA
jgi:hypothetical protein